jgi:hypothetical protein
MKTNNVSKIAMLGLFFFVALSCAPKKQGVRGQIKTGQTSLNPGNSAIAEQQAQAQNAMYKINTISYPTPSDYGVSIDSELLTPSSDYLPITTNHQSSQMDSQGTFSDSSRGLQVLVNSRCSDMDCTKYMLLVTVTRNNQAVFQSGAISYKDDCNFYSISNTADTGGMFQSLDAFASRWGSTPPMGDSTSCLQ